MSGKNTWKVISYFDGVIKRYNFQVKHYDQIKHYVQVELIIMSNQE